MQHDIANQTGAAKESLLRFSVGPYQFCLSALEVVAIITPPHLTVLPMSAVDIAGVFMYQKKMAICIDLRRKFTLQEDPDKDSGELLLGFSDDKLLAFWVDDVSDIVDSDTMSWSALSQLQNDTSVFNGCYLLDEDIILATSIAQMYGCDRGMVSGCLQALVSERVGEQLRKPVSNEAHQSSNHQVGAQSSTQASQQSRSQEDVDGVVQSDAEPTPHQKVVETTAEQASAIDNALLADTDAKAETDDMNEVLVAETTAIIEPHEVPMGTVSPPESVPESKTEKITSKHHVLHESARTQSIDDAVVSVSQRDAISGDHVVATTAAEQDPVFPDRGDNDRFARDEREEDSIRVAEGYISAETRADASVDDMPGTAASSPSDESSMVAESIPVDAMPGPKSNKKTESRSKKSTTKAQAAAAVGLNAGVVSTVPVAAKIVEEDLPKAEVVSGSRPTSDDSLADDDATLSSAVAAVVLEQENAESASTDSAPLASEVLDAELAEVGENTVADVNPEAPSDADKSDVPVTVVSSSGDDCPQPEATAVTQDGVTGGSSDSVALMSTEMGGEESSAEVLSGSVSDSSSDDGLLFNEQALSVADVGVAGEQEPPSQPTEGRDEPGNARPVDDAVEAAAADLSVKTRVQGERDANTRLPSVVVTPAPAQSEFMSVHSHQTVRVATLGAVPSSQDSAANRLDEAARRRSESGTGTTASLTRSEPAIAGPASFATMISWAVLLLLLSLIAYWLWPSAGSDLSNGKSLVSIVAEGGHMGSDETVSRQAEERVSVTPSPQKLLAEESLSGPGLNSVSAAPIQLSEPVLVSEPISDSESMAASVSSAQSVPVSVVETESRPMSVVEKLPLQEVLRIEDGDLRVRVERENSVLTPRVDPVTIPPQGVKMANNDSSVALVAESTSRPGTGFSRTIGVTFVRHIVVSGDTLWHIAKRYLGDPYRYPQLVELSHISNPDRIYPGDIVTIEFLKDD